MFESWTKLLRINEKNWYVRDVVAVTSVGLLTTKACVDAIICTRKKLDSRAG
jgi:hypothetical protein